MWWCSLIFITPCRKAHWERATILLMVRLSLTSSIRTFRLKASRFLLPALRVVRLRCNGLSKTRVTLPHRFATGTTRSTFHLIQHSTAQMYCWLRCKTQVISTLAKVTLTKQKSHCRQVSRAVIIFWSRQMLMASFRKARVRVIMSRSAQCSIFSQFR